MNERPPRRPPHGGHGPRRHDRGSGPGRDFATPDRGSAPRRDSGRPRPGALPEPAASPPHDDPYARARAAGGAPPREERPRREHGERTHAPRHGGERHGPARPHARDDRRPPREHAVHAHEGPVRARDPELRIYGLNACLAAFAQRPHDLRKVWLLESRIPMLRDVLAFCVKHRLGYRVVEDEDLERLTASNHHEGVCFDLRRPHPPLLSERLLQIGQRPSLLLWLDGVGNPHNLGAVLRSAAHFGVDAVLVPDASGLALSGAACRVAEGGAERVPLLQIDDAARALAQLRAAGYALAATLPRDAQSLFEARLPERLVLVFGAEGEGMSRALVEACELQLGIPGTGAVESLNIATAAGVCMAEWVRQRG